MIAARQADMALPLQAVASGDNEHDRGVGMGGVIALDEARHGPFQGACAVMGAIENAIADIDHHRAGLNIAGGLTNKVSRLCQDIGEPIKDEGSEGEAGGILGHGTWQLDADHGPQLGLGCLAFRLVASEQISDMAAMAGAEERREAIGLARVELSQQACMGDLLTLGRLGYLGQRQRGMFQAILSGVLAFAPL